VPDLVRTDRGKDFLSAAVTTALGAMGVTVKDLPAYSPHLKGTVESLNRAADRMLFAALPGYTAAPTGPRPERRGRTAGAVSALSFQDFTAEVLEWTNWWNTAHRPKALPGRTPLEAWQADPTPVTDVPPRRPVGLHPRGRRPAPEADQPRRELARPRLHRRVDDRPGRPPGPRAPHAAPRPRDRGLRRPWPPPRSGAPRGREGRRTPAPPAFAPTTRAEPAQRLGAVTAAQAERELAAADYTDVARLALPDLIPPAPPPAHWRTPPALAAGTAPPPPASAPADPSADVAPESGSRPAGDA
jgi:putative transposase